MKTEREQIIYELKQLEMINTKEAYELSNKLRLELAKIDALELLNQ
jgi:hypothetical protein